jgi:hypothetical protein
MRKLDSMIAQFVDDLLHTIGEATIEELRELFATVPERSKDEPLFPSAELAAAPRRPVPAPRAPRADHAEARRSIAALANVRSASSLPPPAVAEITDPESLLSIVATNGSAPTIGSVRRSAPSILMPVPARATTPSTTTERAQELEGESPASGVRPVGASTVRLSDNETLARVSNSGVVIRRRKKA